MANTETAARMLGAYLDADQPAMAWGAPGIGKSDVARQVAAARGLPLIDLRVTLLDPVDLRGLPHIDSDGRAAWATPVFLPDVTRDGPEGVLFLDEINAAPASTQAACFQLVLDRRVGEYVMPAGWRIIAAGNRQSDRGAAQRMPTPLANRFAHITVDPDVGAWATWANANGVPAVVVAFLRWRPALLHVMPATPDVVAFPTPRSWTAAARHAMAPADVRQSLIGGIVGEAAAAELEGFLRIFFSLPRLSDILADPLNAPVPTDPATLYAVATALARTADRQNFDSVTAYTGRLPREFDILATLDAIKRDQDLTSTTAFVGWASRNADVVL